MENAIQGQSIIAADPSATSNQPADLVATISEWENIADRIRGRVPYTDFSEAKSRCEAICEQFRKISPLYNGTETVEAMVPPTGQLMQTQIVCDREKLCGTVLPALATAAREKGLSPLPYWTLRDSITITPMETLGGNAPELGGPEFLPYWQAAIALAEELKGTAPHTPWKHPSPPNDMPLIVSQSPPQVTISGTAYVVGKKAAELLDALVKANHEWVSGSSVVQQPSRIVAAMPEQVRSWIESSSGKGFRLRRRQ